FYYKLNDEIYSIGKLGPLRSGYRSLIIFQNGRLLETGLMFVTVIYHVLVNLLKLQLMRCAMVCLLIISEKVIMVIYPLTV
ncbi:MAG: hypothetical protein WBQ25_05460, partial [Nitrososphaeraceae archaeon]